MQHNPTPRPSAGELDLDVTHEPSSPSSAYYPSKGEMAQLMRQFSTPRIRQAIRPGYIARTDGFPVDDTIAGIENRPGAEALLSRLLSVSDLTPAVYERFVATPANMSHWLEPLATANRAAGSPFDVPSTMVVRLPIELAQFIRIPYEETSENDRALFNRWVFEQLELDEGKTYFIKTGMFSSKFQFANAKCTEPLEMGEYFQVVNGFAMEVGAGHSVEIVAREYIEDVEGNPTIYNGMPLRTEFRVFLDADAGTLIGTVPYWHPIVMKQALERGVAETIRQDYQTYSAHEDKLTADYNAHLGRVERGVQKLLPHLRLTGKWSLDVMKNGDDLYLIDMAPMEQSALTELLD